MVRLTHHPAIYELAPRIIDPARFRSGLTRRTMRVLPDDWMLDLTIPSKLRFVWGSAMERAGAAERCGQTGFPD